MKGSKDVVVVGGGLSGLTAAEELLKAQPQCSVTVLQALDRVGGRTYSPEINGIVYDLGAQWIGPPQKYARNLAQRAKNELVQQTSQGTKILSLRNKISSYKTDIPLNIGFISLIELQTLIWKIDSMAKKVPLDNPRNCDQAMYWDSITVHTWLQKNLWFRVVKELFEIMIRAIYAVETNQLSFLFFLWIVHQNHGLDCMMNINNGLQEKKMKKGTQYLSTYLRDQVQNRGGKVVLNTKVIRIIQTKQHCQVYTNTQKRYICDYLIMAAPPVCMRKIEFQPQLSRERRLINDRFVMGNYTKIILLYEKRYWKDKQFSGQSISDGFSAPISMSFDDSRTKQNGQIQPGIVVFVAGGIDRQWTKDRQKCFKIVTQKLAQYFNEKQMLNPIKIEMKVWNQEKDIQGAPLGILPPGVLTQISNIRRPEGRIHWAGTQMALISQGYMDGAIESGIRTANEVLTQLRNPEISEVIRKETTQQKFQQSKNGYWYNKIVSAKKKFIEWW